MEIVLSFLKTENRKEKNVMYVDSLSISVHNSLGSQTSNCYYDMSLLLVDVIEIIQTRAININALTK